MVFTKVKCPGDHAEGGRHVQGCGGIVPSAGMRNGAGDCRVGGILGGASVTIYGSFENG